uniref:Chlorophyll a-b binding proteinic n=1 Tax=Rhizophora mucronata TaxID=61149 RepID=A0A2P2L084_RHIMU
MMYLLFPTETTSLRGLAVEPLWPRNGVGLRVLVLVGAAIRAVAILLRSFDFVVSVATLVLCYLRPEICIPELGRKGSTKFIPEGNNNGLLRLWSKTQQKSDWDL